ncbi:MAG: hypothetical protein EZS28_054268, partial [Streblomastix strix]
KRVQRAEIGDIASKIGQLFTQFAVRTMDSRFLLDTRSFFEAIIQRRYFAEVLPAPATSSNKNYNIISNINNEIMNKNLRLHLRHIINSFYLKDLTAFRKIEQELIIYLKLAEDVLRPEQMQGWENQISKFLSFLKTMLEICPAFAPPLTYVGTLGFAMHEKINRIAINFQF